MIVAVVVGIVVGYLLAIPPGPIGIAAIRMGIRQGWRSSVKLAVGAGVFDVIYCAVAMVATSAVVNAMGDVASTAPAITVALQLVIVGVMISFGVRQVLEPPATQDPTAEEKRSGSSLVNWFRDHGPFFVGVGFAIANLANPTFIPALAALAAFVQQLGVFDNRLGNNMLFAVGFGLGNVFWLFTLVRIVIVNRDKLTPQLIKRIQQISGVTLIGFGAFYGIRIITVTNWSVLF